MAYSFDNEFELLFTQSPLFEQPRSISPSCDDVVLVDVPFSNSLLDADNFLLSDVIQGKGEESKKSPFHQSDSGMSEDLGSPSNSENMLDVESMDDEPLFQGADRDLLDYFGCGSSGDEGFLHTSKLKSRENEIIDVNLSDVNASPCRRLQSRNKPTNNVAPISRVTAPPVSDLETRSAVFSLIKQSPPASKLQSVKVVKVIKTSAIPIVFEPDSAEECETPKVLEQNKKNAQNAKCNREKKKAYVQGLESELEKLHVENDDLQKENGIMVNRTAALEEEVEYLKSVLANESTLSKLLKNIDKVKGVWLSSSFQSRKRNANNAIQDHCYDSVSVSKRPRSSTAGVCLHVDDENVSLEFCSHCSKMSKTEENR